MEAADRMSAAVAVEASTVASVDEASAADVVGRVEAVAEGTPEEAVAGEPGVTEWAACPVPAGIKAGVACVLLGEIQVGFAQILRAQAAPFIERISGCLDLC